MIRALLIATGAVLWAAPALAGDWGLEAFQRRATVSRWDGYAPGTAFTRTSTETVGGRTRKSEHSETLLRVEGDTYTWRMTKASRRPGGKPLEAERSEKRSLPVTWTTKDAGKDKVTIGKQTYTCRKVIATSKSEYETTKTTYWIDPTHGVVQFADDSTYQATRLEVKKKIGEHTFRCREFTAAIQGGTSVMLLPLHAPDRALAHRIEVKSEGVSIVRAMTKVTIKKASKK